MLLLMKSYLQWMSQYQPEHLEGMLKDGTLEDHLDKVRQRTEVYGRNLAERGLKPYQVEEYQREAIMPTDQPDTKARLSKEGRALLKEFVRGRAENEQEVSK